MGKAMDIKVYQVSATEFSVFLPSKNQIRITCRGQNTQENHQGLITIKLPEGCTAEVEDFIMKPIPSMFNANLTVTSREIILEDYIGTDYLKKWHQTEETLSPVDQRTYQEAETILEDGIAESARHSLTWWISVGTVSVLTAIVVCWTLTRFVGCPGLSTARPCLLCWGRKTNVRQIPEVREEGEEEEEVPLQELRQPSA